MSDERKLAHDLRHLLTLAELECEWEGPQAARAALERLRQRCEWELSPARHSTIEVGAWLEALAGELRHLRPSARLEVAGSGTCSVAEGALRRLLRNLMLNALEAGGRVECHAARERNILRVQVRDDAGGIPRERLQRCLMEGHSSHQSTGLGSASVEECARLLRATIRVRALSPGGTEFEIGLPAGDGAPPERASGSVFLLGTRGSAPE